MLTRLLGQMVAVIVAVNILVAAPAEAGAAGPVRIVAFGDSLTAGFGLAASEAFPAELERRLKAKGYDVEVANAGISGDTTGRALVRLDWAVPDGTDAVIVALGANDMLNGLPLERTRANLEAIVERLTARGIVVMLAGMRASRSLGAPYADAFDGIYADLARKHGLIPYPFFLDGVALDPKLNLPDGIHPTAAGIAIVTERMLPTVERLIERARSRPAPGGRG
jgi:acyl-CoA thioesterase-1